MVMIIPVPFTVGTFVNMVMILLVPFTVGNSFSSRRILCHEVG